MANWNYFYLVRIEFLGFRYHGWQPQPGLKSVQGMVDKTFKFIFQHENFYSYLKLLFATWILMSTVSFSFLFENDKKWVWYFESIRVALIPIILFLVFT